MGKPYRVRDAQILCKLETAPGAADDTPALAADMFLAQDVSLALSFANTPNEGLTASFSKQAGVTGIQTGVLSFKIPLKYSGTAGTGPEYEAVLLSCGMTVVNTPVTSDVYSPTAPDSTFTYTVIYQGLGAAGEDLIVRLVGCQGNMVVNWKAGELLMAEFTVTGVWMPVVDGTRLAPAAWDDALFSAFLAPTFVCHSTALTFETFTMDMGNEVVIRPDANSSTGAIAAQIVNRRVTGTVDPEAEKAATFNIFTKATGNDATDGIGMAALGAVGDKILLALPKVRFFAPTLAERNQILTTPVSYEALMTAVIGNDEFSITMS